MTPLDPPAEPDLVLAFRRAAHTLVDDYDVVELAQQLVEDAAAALAVDGAALLLVDDRGRLQVLAAAGVDDPDVLARDDGPGAAALRGAGTTVLVDDVAGAAGRWGGFADAAAAAGIAAVSVVVLRLRRRTVGVLALVHPRPDGLPAADVHAAEGLAAVATVGILNHRLASRAELLHEQLQTALNTRTTVEQASGVLAELLGTTPAQGLAVLREHCRRRGLALSEVARAVVERRVDVATLTAG